MFSFQLKSNNKKADSRWNLLSKLIVFARLSENLNSLSRLTSVTAVKREASCSFTYLHTISANIYKFDLNSRKLAGD